MEYTKLGHSDLKVSRICLGCMGFGDAKSGMHSWTLGEENSREIMKRALELGVNFFDTAIGYQGGTSEQFVGRAIKALAKRSDVVIATKFLPRENAENESTVTARAYINQMIDTSLSNLGTDYIDLYILHRWDHHTPVEETMEALNDIVKAGKARYIGISNCYAWQLSKANNISEKNGWSKFVSVQGHYNLLYREEEREMAPYCYDAGIAMTPYSPLASGRLVKPSQETSKRFEEDTFAKGKYDATADQDSAIIGRAVELAEKRNMTRIQIALGWLLSKVTSPVVGATKLSHIEEAVKAVDVSLTEEEKLYLEELYVPHRLVGVMAQNH